MKQLTIVQLNNKIKELKLCIKKKNSLIKTMKLFFET